MPTIVSDEPAWAKGYPPAPGFKPPTIRESLAKGFDDGAVFYLHDERPNARSPRPGTDPKRDQNHRVAVPHTGVCAARYCQVIPEESRRSWANCVPNSVPVFFRRQALPVAATGHHSPLTSMT